MLQTLKGLLLKIVDDIDSGNSNVDEEEEIKIIKALQRYTRKDNSWNKYQAYTYLNISRATFDRYIKEGKIPPGKKEAGSRELKWSERDIRRIKKKGI